MRARVAGVAVMLLVGCAAGLRDGRFTKEKLTYRLEAPPEPAFRRVSFAENDLAWSSPGGHLVATNSTCKDHGDPTLEVLTGHLLLGFDERTLIERQTLTLDGRAALKSLFDVSIDGVPAEVEVVVLKKNGCVHDFTYVAPRGQRGAHQAQFDAMVRSFVQESAP